MAGDTSIEWTHIVLPNGEIWHGTNIFRGRSWNPMTGCNKISPGCDHCYAEVFAERWRGTPGHAYEQGFDFKLWPDRLSLPLSWQKPCGIFVNSMSDWCYDEAPDAYILAMFTTMITANWHIYQLLTKRAPRMVALVPKILDLAEEMTGVREWPVHIWPGVSVESYQTRGRLTHLRKLPPEAVRWVSAEPLLGSLAGVNLQGIDWIVTGAESGHGARPCQEEWVRELRDSATRLAIPFFYKQKATPSGKKIPYPTLDGVQHRAYPSLMREE